VDRDRMHTLAVIQLKGGMVDPANVLRLVKDCIENGPEIAQRGIDDLQDLGGRDLLRERLVTRGFALSKFSLTLGKLTFEIGYSLLGIG
jgi:hypothetical protein